MKIMSNSPSRHPFSLQGKLNDSAMVRNATIFLFHSYKMRDNIFKHYSTAFFRYFVITVTDSLNII